MNRAPGPRLPDPTPHLLLIAFALTALVGVWAAYDRGAAWQRFGLIAAGLINVAAILWAVRLAGKAILGPICVGCGLIAAALAAYFLLAYDWNADGAGKFAAVQGIGAWIQAHRPAVRLPEDINGNVAGNALALLLPLGCGGAIWAWRRAAGSLAVAISATLAVTLAGIALALTSSRGAWLGLGAGALAAGLLAASEGGRPHSRPLALPGFAVLILGSAAVFAAAIFVPGAERLLGSVGGVGQTAMGRAALWRDGLALAGDYPFTGAGLGSTMMVYSTYAMLLHVGFITHSHNLFLQIALEQGAPGLALLIGLLGLAFRQIGAAGPGREERLWQSAAAASLTALIVHGMLDTGVYASRVAWLLFLPLGFALTLPAAGAGRPRRPQGVPGGPGAAGLLAAALILAACAALLPATRAAFQANLGAVLQTRAELAGYTWPQWPIQDALRRSPAVNLAPAEARYTAALALAPGNAVANRRMGQIALSRGRYDAARRYLEAAYAAAPWQSPVLLLLGEAYAVTGDPARGAALWRTAGSAPDRAEGRAWWYRSINEPERAAWVAEAAGLAGR